MIPSTSIPSAEAGPNRPASLIASGFEAHQARCPFHDGTATLDLLLAELNPNDTPVFDAALDLRAAVSAHADANDCVDLLLRVRALLDESHYLAFYRVRCWARRALRIEVRPSRQAAWISRELPLNGARIDEILNDSFAALAVDGVIPASAHARFVFAAGG